MTASDRSPALDGLTKPAHDQQTGCLHLHDQSRTHAAQAYYDNGRLYAVHVRGFRPALADRMLTAGLLDQVLHDQVIVAAGGDPRNADIGHLAVRRGMIGQETLDAIHREILLSAITAITTWEGVRTRFRRNSVTTLYTVPAVPVTAVLTAVERRATHWHSIWRDMAPGCAPQEAVPRCTGQFPVALDLSPDARTLLSRIDGVRTLDALAGECGLTRFEASHLLHTLTVAGLATASPDPNPTFETEPSPEPAATPAVAPSVTPAAKPAAPTLPTARPTIVSSDDPPARPLPETPKVKPVRRSTTPVPPPRITAPDPAPEPAPVQAPAPAVPVNGLDLDAARTAYADAQARIRVAEQRASEAYTDHTRIAAVASDARHNANQAARSHEVAIAEELTANQHLALAQAALDKAHELTTLTARATRELEDRAASATNDADRARQRVHDTAAAVTAAQEHLDAVSVALARAQHAAAA
jgi:hypothetical protein